MVMQMLWQSQCCFNKEWFRLSLKQKVKDQFLQHWNSFKNSSSGPKTYRIFKDQFGINTCFYILNNIQCRLLTAFRTRNNRLPVELGRWSNIQISERKCHLCHTDVGDEFHYLLKCTTFVRRRKLAYKTIL